MEEFGLACEVVPVDTSKGEQHTPAFRAINPNGKVPAIVDTDGPGGAEARVFDSSAARAKAVAKDHPFKRESDEKTKRALFPSNNPETAM